MDLPPNLTFTQLPPPSAGPGTGLTLHMLSASALGPLAVGGPGAQASGGNCGPRDGGAGAGGRRGSAPGPSPSVLEFGLQFCEFSQTGGRGHLCAWGAVGLATGSPRGPLPGCGASCAPRFLLHGLRGRSGDGGADTGAADPRGQGPHTCPRAPRPCTAAPATPCTPGLDPWASNPQGPSLSAPPGPQLEQHPAGGLCPPGLTRGLSRPSAPPLCGRQRGPSELD